MRSIKSRQEFCAVFSNDLRSIGDVGSVRIKQGSCWSASLDAVFLLAAAFVALSAHSVFRGNAVTGSVTFGRRHWIKSHATSLSFQFV